MARNKAGLPAPSSRGEIDAFLSKAAALPAKAPRGGEAGRLIFAMDATASREPTWDRACELQGQMFVETAALGGIEVQLCYFRGFREFAASGWLRRSPELLRHMQAVRCRGGITQIERVLKHAARQARETRISALVLIGDCMEEDIDRVCAVAGELGMLSVPVFAFHEGFDPVARRAFGQIAHLSGGACCRFDPSSPQHLRDLLGAVAVYAAGGRRALGDFSRRRGGLALDLSRRLPRA